MEPAVLICAPADAPTMVRGSSFDYRCHRCNECVMLAPSGQRYLKQHPNDTVLMCLPCAKATVMRDPNATLMTENGMVSEPNAVGELEDIVPNVWRKRN